MPKTKIVEPPPCDPAVFTHGTAIASLHGPRMHTIEDYIVRVRERSGQQVDWHFVGGIARIVFIGDGNKVRAALEAEWIQLLDDYMRCPDNFAKPPKIADVWIRWA